MSAPQKLRGLNPLHLLGTGAVGAALALLIQAWLSSRGRPSILLPYSMAITLVALAVLLVVLGLRLRKHVAKGTGAVNPFQAVRLLATARAGQIVGAGFAGFGGGLLLSLLGRSVPAPTPTWLPMLVTAAAGVVLLVCALIAERLCRVPPSDDPEGESDPGLATLET
ncbi:hypothetical protein ACIFOC_01168 [Leucobacter aridicollis]|uniref:DUF3180 domain-containing protein n=1 Tax=Leucobacter aridicollis TaxID=283878 RepID=UPI0021684B29|nr:DUF3180 domain-containing protein [Leucobacter aridicollis]MCS3427491.1 hypothetical protein [Leucobacter aridicollis]